MSFTNIKITSPVPPCPKCGSYMFMPREICTVTGIVVHFNKCKNCGFKGLEKGTRISKVAIKIYFERFTLKKERMLKWLRKIRRIRTVGR